MIRSMFGCLEDHTVELAGSGSNEHVLLDIGLAEIFGSDVGNDDASKTSPEDFLNLVASSMTPYRDNQ
ncbi:hypothetical protein F441_11535 [Phytophthora nicotianae CJ01A1]|uniref:Uncharacterized protein n=3 Tax=Phytophthora nicotianae TaxID=4792 RepID=W2IS32_PHYNI|nr:hypothetical protein L915_11303 [Phytophthora nicotianae]ETL36896.1 hypothetical protein L916_11203 [Phytophthora nicotianae]ETO72070.1 hypothetical protein F444_11695 [Phytophthora nicotianae P1976]ETP13221.1 hypothetical protein F441_11535 [Phytophthora nicotianae CJ01A1]